jgi:hypothetical protein
LPTRRIRDELIGPAIELLERAVAQEPAEPAPAEDAPPAVGDLVEAERVPPSSLVERETGSVAARLPDGRGLHGWPLVSRGFDWPGMLREGARCRLLAVGLTAEECEAATSREAARARRRRACARDRRGSPA